MKNTFTRVHTNFIKDVSICLLLWHHLFYNADSNASFITHNLSEILSYYAKVCVSIFIILSGYGLNESDKTKNLSLYNFYKKSFKKLYFNYWLIWILLVAIGVLVFDRTFSIVYTNHVFLKLILNILGIQRIFSFHGYNSTWWFMSLILGLYLLFPFLKRLVVTGKYLWRNFGK